MLILNLKIGWRGSCWRRKRTRNMGW